MAITVRQLEHALALAETGNFTRAAERAHLTQSALSRSIEKLEGELGVPLFDRIGRTIIANAYGRALLKRAAEVHATMEQVLADIDAIDNILTGHLHVALGVYPAEICAPRAIGRLLQNHPQLTVRAEVCNWQDVTNRVMAGLVDLAYAVVDPALAFPALDVETVSAHELAYYARSGHPLAGRSEVTAKDLQEFPLVSIRVPQNLAAAVHGKAAIDGETGYLIPAVEIDDFTLARGTVRSSDAIGVTTPIQIMAELERGELVLLRYARPWITPRYGFIQKRGLHVCPAAQRFKTLVREVEAETTVLNEMLLDRYL